MRYLRHHLEELALDVRPCVPRVPAGPTGPTQRSRSSARTIWALADSGRALGRAWHLCERSHLLIVNLPICSSALLLFFCTGTGLDWRWHWHVQEHDSSD